MKKINFITLIYAEFLKYRKSPALFLTFGAPIFLALVVFLIFFFKADKLIENSEQSMSEYFSNSYRSLALLMPLYLILLNIFVFNIEYKSNTFKSLFSLPVSRNSIILSKLFVVVFMLVSSAVIFQIMLCLGFYINSFKYNDLFVFNLEFIGHASLILLQMTGVSLMVLVLQFYFSFKWKNVIVAMSLGIMGFISFLILIQGWKHIVYHPYAFPALSLKGLNLENELFSNQLLYSLLGCALFLGALLLEVNQKKVIE